MEIAIREYGIYRVVLLGAVSACVLLYMLCRYLYCIFSPWLTKAISMIGQHTMFILIVHKLFSSSIKRFVGISFVMGHIYHTGVVVALQVIAGVAIGVIYALIQKRMAKVFARKAA